MGTYLGGVDLSAEKIVSVRTIRGLSLTERSLQDINAAQYQILTYKTVFTGGLTLRVNLASSIRTTPIVASYYNRSFNNQTLTNLISTGLSSVSSTSYSTVTVGPPNIYMPSNGNLGTYTNGAILPTTSVTAVTNDGSITYSYTGTLPTGLSLNASSGAITGTASFTGTTSTTYNFTVTAATSGQTVSAAFNITFNPSEPNFNYNAMVVHADGPPTTVTTGVFTGSISGTTLNISSVTSGWLGPGSLLVGTNILANTYVTAMGSGSYGSLGTYTVSVSQTVNTTVISAQGAANNSIIQDLSPYNNSVQRYVNHGTGTFSPFSQPVGYWSTAFGITGGSASIQTANVTTMTYGYSGVFNGTTQYLTIADNASLQMGSGDFTIETWYFQNNVTSIQTIYDKGYLGTGSLLIQTAPGSGLIMINTGSAIITSLPTYSIQFDGTSQQISVASNAAFALPGDFTIEGWFYKTTSWYTSGNASLVEGSLTNGFSFYVNGNGTTGTLRSGPTNVSSYSLGALPIMTTNTWYHIAFTRKTNSARGYINGTPVGAAVADSNSYGTTSVHISWSADNYFSGYMSNIRIVKGTAVYDPASATITVPTATLTNIAGTVLLTAQSATIVDNSTANSGVGWTIGITGSPTVSSSVIPSITTTSSSGAQGYSAIFNGTSNYLTTTANSLTTENFTFECFFFLTSNLTYARPDCYGARLLTVNAVANGIEFHILSSSLNTTIPSVIQFCDAGATRINFMVFNLFIPIGVWNHVAATRNGTNWAIWLNGTRIGLLTNNSAVFAAGALYIGGAPTATSYLEYFPGYISNLRLVKAVVYDTSLGNITVPTTTLTNIANTYLLACHAATFVDGSTNVFTVTATGSTVAQLPNPFMTFTEPATLSYNIVPINTWQHISITRNGSNFRVFRNGGQVGSTLNFSNNFNAAYTMAIGAGLTNSAGATPGQYFNGNISAFRIFKGTAVYTSNFLAPYTPFPPGSGVTAISSYGVTFNGTSQYLTVPVAAATFGANNYTVECWVKFNTNSIGYQPILMSYQAADATGWVVYTESNNTLNALATSTAASWTQAMNTTIVPAIQTWYHLAVVRNGTTMTFYINGVGSAPAAIGAATALLTPTGSAIGYYPYFPGGARTFNGTISNVRYVIGTAVYTGNFTPLSSPLTATQSASGTFIQAITGTQTKLLTCQNDPIVDNSPVPGVITNVGGALTTSVSIPVTSGGATLLACQNATITIDQGSNNFVIVNNGAATISTTITPFLSGNHLVITTEDYTIEGFAMRNTISTSNVIASHGGYDGLRNFSLIRLNNGLYGTWGNNYQFFVVPGSTTTDDKLFGYPGKWFHFAISRSSGQAYFHINGIQVGAVYDSSYINLNNMYIGNNIGTASLEWTGHISNFRITKGSAIYAYNSTFTPPTSPLIAGTNTLLLACSSNFYLEDRSGRKVVLTRNNDVSSSPFTPFTSYSNGVDKTYSPTTVSGSMSFNGSNEFVSIPDATQFNFSTGKPWTIEYWIWPSGNYSQSRTMFAKRVSNSGDISIQGYLRTTSGVFGILIGYGGGSYGVYYGQYETTTTPQPHTWSHVAYVYEGNSVCSVYLNGVKIFNASGFAPYNSSTTFTIGALNNATEFFQGYISNFRVLNGTRLYSSTQNTVNTIPFGTYSGGSFTPPSAPLTVITDTVLLITNANNAGYDTASRNNFYFNGAGNSTNTAISSAVTYLGAKSLKFNGTNDWFASAQIYNISGFNNPIFYFGTGDWTVEFWVYFSVVTGNQTLVDFRPGGTASTANYIVLQLISGVLNYYTATVTAIAGPTLVATTWYHVSLSRQFNKTRLFVNGLQQGQDYTDTQTYTVGLTRPIFGTDYSTANFMNGYMDEIRITRYARYAGQFTAPTAEHPDTSTGDTDFIHSNLIVHGNGNNTQTNNTFVDTTGNNSFVRTGTPGQGTFTPFSRAAGYWSNHFNGGTDYLTVSNVGNDTTSLTLVSGNWTIEGWLLEGSSTRSNPLIIGNYFTTANYSNNKWGIFFSTSASRGSFVMTAYNSGFTISSGTTFVNVGKWNHFAFVRSGNQINIYVNGNLANSANYAANIDNGTIGKFFIGDAGGDPTTFFNGYISNLRVVKGVAVYTGAFTPPTSTLAATQSSGTNIAAISGTSTLLLTCQNYNFVDNSTNTWFVIPTGNVSTQTTQPFAISSAYSTSTNGGSLMFYGTPDYLTTNATQILPSNGIFTIQCWVYPTAPYVYDESIFAQGTSAAAGFEFYIQASSNSLAVLFNNTIVTSTNVIRINTWTHVAVTSSGSTVAFYINGVASGSSSLAVTPPNNAGIIGDDWNHTVDGFTGYISNLKIDNSVLSISLPTAPFTSATTLLMLGINGGMIDNVSKYDLVTVGSTQLSTINKKYGTGSMFFNGTTDYISVGPTFNSWFPSNTQLTTTSQGALPNQVQVLTCQTSAIIDNGTGSGSIPQPTYIPTTTYGGYFNGTNNFLTLTANSAWTFGTGDFAVESWIRSTNVGVYNMVFENGGASGGDTTGFSFGINPSAQLYLYTNGTTVLTSSSTLLVNTWYHVAIVRYSGTHTLYLNGVSVGTISTAYNWTANGSITGGGLLIGRNAANTVFMTGYLSNYRIVKGTAVYTGAFTPSGPLNRIQSSGISISALSGTETVLLTLQNNTIVDNSIAYGGGGIAIANSNPPVNVVSFPTGAGYAITNTGTVTSTNSVIPFSGTYSYSFNGSTQNLYLANFTPFQTTATAPFTIEAWIYVNSYIGVCVCSCLFGPSAIPYAMGFCNGVDPGTIGSYPYFASHNGSVWFTLLTTTTFTGAVNTWYHMATSYDGTTLRLFINGSVIASLVTATPAHTAAGAAGFYIGRRWDGGGSNFFNGYISNFRFTKGSALYTGTTSMLPVPVQHTSPFTIECWIYITSYTTMTIYSQFSLTTPDRFWFGIDNSLGYKLVLFHGRFGSTFGNTAVPLNQWNHVSVTRDTANRILIHLNGVLDGSASNFTNGMYQVSARIGNLPTNTNYFSGYIDDLRISLFPRYTSNFTVPTKYLDQ